jgi:prepilin-type N-terminal cleavage/methylation domain-containing protein
MDHSPSNGNAISSRRAFSLAEIIVSVTIVALLAAVVLPTVMSRLAIGNGNAIAAELTSLALGLKAFNTNVGTYPQALADISGTPSSSTSKTYCGLTMTPTQVAKWRGPYVSRFIQGDYVIDNSTIVNTMTYTAGPPAYLQITIDNVTADVARAMEEAIDGPVVANSYTTGAFTYTAPNAVFNIPVRAC